MTRENPTGSVRTWLSASRTSDSSRPRSAGDEESLARDAAAGSRAPPGRHAATRTMGQTTNQGRVLTARAHTSCRFFRTQVIRVDLALNGLMNDLCRVQRADGALMYVRFGPLTWNPLPGPTV